MWALVVLFFIIVLLAVYLDTRKPSNFPLGPTWLPVLGSALAVKKARQETGYLCKAACLLQKKYCKNGVLGLRVGKDRIIIPCDLESIREMLLNEDIDGRPQGIFYETRTWGKRRGIVLIDGEAWKDQRRFLIRHLKEFGLGRRGMSKIIIDESKHLLEDMKAKLDNSTNSAVLQMHDAFSLYVLNTIWYMMAGIRYSSKDAELKKLQGLIYEIFSSVDMVGALFSHFPILRYLAPDMSGYKHFLNSHKRIWEFLRAELDKHKMNYKDENIDRDFMDVYIRMLKSKDKKTSFTESQLLALCMDIFMAGSETTSKSLGFGFLNLVREQEVQKKAQREIDAVIGRERLSTAEDRLRMPYNEAIVLESIRHFMGRNFGIPHRVLRDTKLCGYTLPKDAMVVANLSSVLMNENIFKNAKEFQPERFLVDGKISIPETYIPFGIGKHRCIGEALARSNIFHFTVTMLQNFNLKIAPGKPLPTEEAVDGATSSAPPFYALLEPRQK